MINNSIPYVSNDLIDYLYEIYNLDYLLSLTKGEVAEYKLGYMKGARDLISHLRSLQEEQDEVM